MSHTAVHPCAITGVNKTFLNAAIEMAAEDHKLKIEHNTKVTNYMGSDPRECATVLRGEGVQYGIGVEVTANGDLTFVGDNYGSSNHSWNRVKESIIKHYSIMAIRAGAADTESAVGDQYADGRDTIIELEVA